MKQADVDKMTMQEAVEYSVTQLVAQGGRCTSIDEDGLSACEYGNSKGQHCAIGWLLDEDNQNLMSHPGDLGDLVQEHYGEIPNVILDNLEIFELLQTFHDSTSKPYKAGALKALKANGVDISNEVFERWVQV